MFPNLFASTFPDGVLPEGRNSPYFYIQLYTPGKTDISPISDTSPLLPLEGQKFVQQIGGKFLYYRIATDRTMLSAATMICDNMAAPKEAT